MIATQICVLLEWHSDISAANARVDERGERGGKTVNRCKKFIVAHRLLSLQGKLAMNFRRFAVLYRISNYIVLISHGAMAFRLLIPW